ncbi:hypothetical protein [Brucella pseudogrignonensis]|uniref:hypothetical protein n=1 Tax=Brucella pseudogrignonensis TaxID=419475 RepID=UPI003ECE2FA5
MIDLLAFPVIVFLFGFFGWYQTGAIVLIAFGVNSLLGCIKAYKNPDWYRLRRSQALKDTSYLEADDSVVQRDIQSMLLTKVFVTLISTLGAVYFAVKAGWI